MQTPQTNQTIKQFTPKIKFLIFAKTGLLQATPPTRDLVPRSWTIRRRGGERKQSRRSSTPPTRDSAPCRRRASVKINFRREMATSENENIGRSTGRTTMITGSKDSVFDASRGNTGKMMDGNG